MHLESSGGILSHVESSGIILRHAGSTQGHPGSTQETPRRHRGGTQEAPRRHPGSTQNHPGGTQETPQAPKGAFMRHPEAPRRHPGGTPEAPRGIPGGTQKAAGGTQRQPEGTQETREVFQVKIAKTILFYFQRRCKRQSRAERSDPTSTKSAACAQKLSRQLPRPVRGIFICI